MAGENQSTITNNQALLKEMYGFVNNIAQQRARTYELFAQSTRPIAGKYYISAEHVSGAQGSAGTRPEAAELPPAQNENYVNGKIFDRYHYAGFLYTGPAMRHAKGGAYSFANLVASETMYKTKWIIDMLNTQCYGDGWDILGVVGSESYAGGVMTIVLSSFTNKLWLRKGVRFDVYTSDWKTGAAPTKRNAAGPSTGLTVNTFDPATGTIVTTATPDITAGVVAGDVIVFEDIMGADGLAKANTVSLSRQSTASGGEGGGLSGLAVMVDDGTVAASYQSVDRTGVNAQSEYRATVMGNGGVARALTLDLMQKCIDEIGIAGGSKPDTIIMGQGQRRNLLALGLPDVRHESQKMHLGFTTLNWNGHEIFVDEVCPPGLIYMLRRKDNIWRYQSLPLGPLDDDVAPARMRRSRLDAYEGYIATYFNLGCDEPNDNGVIKDLVEPS